MISPLLSRTTGGAAVFVLAGLLEAAPARANIVFDFSGDCSGGYLCGGPPTGVLTLADSYTFGTDITSTDFISFEYSSSIYSLNITSADAPVLVGGLNADGSFNSAGQLGIGTPPGLYEHFFGASARQFVVGTNFRADSWTIGGAPTFTLVSGAVPEPSTWAMMLLGFAGLGYAGCRRGTLTRRCNDTEAWPTEAGPATCSGGRVW
jgi:hypothetical protein